MVMEERDGDGRKELGVRFGFILDEDLKIAASDHDVKAALARKITRDRIGHEINLMISCKHPDQAMTYIWDAQIFLVIFSVPHQLELPASEESIVFIDTGRLCVACMSDALRIMQKIEAEDYAFDHAALLLSMLLYPMDVNSTTSADSQIELDKRRAALFRIIESKIIKLDLEKIWETKPLLNGNDIINVLDLKGGGPLIGELQKKPVEQQLLRRCRNRDECIEWLKQTHPKCSEKFDFVTKPTDRENVDDRV
ncbi:hypothetical protein LguiA_025998 [Lonicera macranthoides]